MAIDFATPEGQVRLLINDVDPDHEVFSAGEISAFLALSGGSVKLSAATALDTIASNEALKSKVIRTQDLQTDGAKLAAELRKHAATLRAEGLEEVEDGGFFQVVDFPHGTTLPEYL